MASLRSRRLWAATSLALALCAAASVSLAERGAAAPARRAPRSSAHGAASSLQVVSAARRILLGRSAEGRAIIALEVGRRSSPHKVLVVGCTHGDECAGSAIATRLAGLRPRFDLWIIPDLNPDGGARGSRGNAHGVDLNRNFPWHWQRLYGLYNSGPRALSERESRIAYKLILRLRPAVSIWFHQHLAVVDESGGSLGVERRFATLTGLPLARLTREPGSITSWQDHTLPGTAFVVELPAGALTPAAARRYARAVLAASG